MILSFAKSMGFSLDELENFTVGQLVDMKIEDYNLRFSGLDEGLEQEGTTYREATPEDWANF